MDGRWRDVGDGSDEDLLQIPVPAGCQNGVSGSKSRFLMVAAQWNSIWEKNQTPDSFRSKCICRRKGGLEEAAGVASPPPDTARPKPRPLVVSLAPSPSLSRLVAPWVFW
jgi:hypothetical protein